MSYELNRIRLFGIGPRGARYTDVTLDLSEVGAVIPTQGSLFAAPVRRPSPFSLLLLENGGGKSVLLKLVFGVVLPGKRNTVGGTAAVMDKFVVGDDAAHVVLEWMNVRTGDRVITGKTIQRRRSAAAGERLAEHWWSLRPHADVEIATLPFTDGTRRLRLEGFREALQEIDRAAPVTQLNWNGPEVGEWAEHLRTLGIEPDMFSIQRRMNADEGDAANAFKFSSSKEFVDWLLKIVLDPDDATSVAENFDSYATTVGDRIAMLLERDFVAGAVATLRPVADAWREHRDAATAHADAVRRAGELLAAVRARHRAEDESAGSLKARELEAAKARDERESDRDRARDVTNEIRRQTLALELRDAETGRELAAAARDDADADLSGWAVADLIERRGRAEADAAALAHSITEAEHAARPALEARDDAAALLLTKLHAEAAAARDERDRQEQEAVRLGRLADALDTQRSVQLSAAATARSEHAAADKVVVGARARVEQAVADRLLPAGQDVAAAEQDALAEHERAQLALTGAEQQRGVADEQVRARSGERTVAEQLAQTARQDRQRAASALGAVRDSAAPLLAAERVRAALATEQLTVAELEAAASSLAGQLADDAQSASTQLGVLQHEQDGDQRLLDALGDGGLLPPRAAVDAALDVLERVGIAAHAGWRYLAETVPAADRPALVQTCPQLVDGIVLVDPSALAAAQQALHAARLLPSAAVAVGTGTALLSALDASSDGASDHAANSAADRSAPFVIEPTPALFDTDAAEQRRLEVRDQMAERADRIGELTATADELAELLGDLRAWQRTCPPGRLAELEAADADAERALAEAAGALGTAEEQLRAAEAERDRLDRSLPALRTAERDADRRLERLRTLAEQARAADEARARLAGLLETAEAADRRAGEIKDERDKAVREQTEAARAVDEARGRAERLVAEMREVATSRSQRPGSEQPAQSLPELRSAYQAAVAAYAKVEVGADLKAASKAAEAEAARLRALTAQEDAAAVARAEQLLTSPAGTDLAARQAEVARVTRRREDAERDLGAAIEKVGRLGSELKSATPADNRNVWTVLVDKLRPTSVEHGRELLELAAAQQREAQSELDTAQNAAVELKRQAEAAVETARAFRDVLRPLAALLGQAGTEPAPAEPAAAAPFDGTAEEAEALTEQVQGDLRAASLVERRTGETVTRLVDAAVRFANDTRFEAMTNVARRALVGLDRDQVAARADEFADQLAQRLATLTTDLESAGRHRKLIVDRLCALVDGALKTLRTASRLSKLPAALGDWEGKEFLRIRFSEPDSVVLAARVGEVVDEIAAATATRSATARGSAPKRDGLTLLLRSLEAAVPKGFTVEVLKPDAVLRDERVPVENMNEVFSGGQELTAAIVLYCTMAALRDNERGQMRAKHSGVLFLDNPIGKASAEYLLELQQGVAQALGVQLVYTTGLSDDRALAAFPLWVRMRNDADLRAGMKHIRVAETVRRQLPDPFSDDEASLAETAPGTVTATRVFRHPA